MLQTFPTRPRAARHLSAIDWVVPAAAALALGLAGIAAMGAGSAADTSAAPQLMRAALVPIGAAAEPGSPRVTQRLDSASGAIDRCDAVTGTCRSLPVEDTAYRMSDGSQWIARTAYDDRGQVEYTLWYNDAGTLVGAPRGL